MPFVEFVGQSRKDGNRSSADPSRLLNLYREPVAGQQSSHILKSVLGTVAFADTGEVFTRAAREIEGGMFVISGGYLFSVDSAGSETQLGAVVDDTATTLSGNNGNVCVTANGRYWVWDIDGATLSEPDLASDAAFSDVGSAFFLGQRTFLTERDGRRVQWSSLADPTTFDALDFATTESRGDKNLRGLPINDRAWLFKEESIEVWALTGATDVVTPLQTLDIGLRGFNLLASYPNGAFFVGSDGVVYLAGGAGLQPISTTAVETSIENDSPARCFYHEDEGHKFCVIRFPHRPAWVYDISTGEWHERAYGAELGAWPVVETVKAYGNWYAASDLGNIDRLARVNADVSEPLLRRAVSRTLLNGGEYFTVPELELYADQGAGSIVDDGAQIDVRCWIRISRDRGNTWGLQKTRSLGKQGEYAKRTRWTSLGRARAMNFEFNMADPVDMPIQASAKVKVTA